MRFLLSILFIFATLPSLADSVYLTTKNTMRLDGPITMESVAGYKKELSRLNQKRRTCSKPIYIVINSPGGSVYAGLNFITYAKSICNLHTISIFAASMASAIVEQLPGSRLGVENNVMMFHRAKGSFRGQFEEGEVESRLALWKKIVRSMEQKSADRIGITLKDYKKRITSEWWTYGEDSVSSNIIDKIVKIKCSAALENKTVKQTQQTIFGSVSREVSACPLL